MSTYAVRRWTKAVPDLTDKVFSPETEPFCQLPCAQISLYPWDESGYRPEARAYAGLNDDGLIVLMCAKEETIIAAETKFGGAVCRDSCLEFFFNPRPSQQDAYINVEVNCAGIMHIAFGDGRQNRRVLAEMPDGVRITHSRHSGTWWAVCYTLPYSLIGEPESEIRANFYTCDETLHEHYGTWNPVVAPHPDFHRPECFGVLRLED